MGFFCSKGLTSINFLRTIEAKESLMRGLNRRVSHEATIDGDTIIQDFGVDEPDRVMSPIFICDQSGVEKIETIQKDTDHDWYYSDGINIWRVIIRNSVARKLDEERYKVTVNMICIEQIV